jgi:hypothetical protein
MTHTLRATPMRIRPGVAAAAMAAFCVLAQACGDVNRPSGPATVTKLAGDKQFAIVGSAVPKPPSVKVVDASGDPVSGATVTFAVASGGGSVTGPTAATDASGIAAVGGWTLGAAFGANTLTATVMELAPVTFTATGTAGAEQVQSGDNQTATVGSPVAVRPAVLVQDGNHQPIANASVAFTVVSGDGSVTGPTATSDSAGVATVGSWVLGTTRGTNTLAATVTGAMPVVFTATGTAGPAARFARYVGEGLTGTAGSAVPVPPAVLVADAYGNPAPGATVTFAVSSGGGSVTGVSAITDTNGIATVGGWVLGPAAGANTLTATVSGLPSVTFTVTGSAGPPAAIVKQAGDGQTASVGVAVATTPAVSVKDAYGNPVRAVAVTFTVTSGGGSPSLSTVSTDTSGKATAGSWTLGPTAGTNTLSAVVRGLPAVTFTATAVDPCATATAYTIGSSVTGALAMGHCRLASGEYTDLYSATVTGTLSVRLDLSSSAFITDLNLFDGNGSLVAPGALTCDDNGCGPNSSTRVLLGPGNYVAGAGGYTYDYNGNPVGGVVGPYTLSSVVVPEDVAGCEQVFITRGVTTAQRIESTDCTATFRSASYFSDQFTIQLTAGQTYTISMSSADFDTYLELFQQWDGTTVASNDDFGGTTNSQITFTPTVSGLYVINAATYLGDKTGAYTLVIQ